MLVAMAPLYFPLYLSNEPTRDPPAPLPSHVKTPGLCLLVRQRGRDSQHLTQLSDMVTGE